MTTAPGSRWPSFGLLSLASLVALAALGLGSTGTLSSWTTAGLQGNINTALTGSLAITHTYAGGSCAGGARISGPIVCSPGLGTSSAPPATSSDLISNQGTVPVTGSVSGVSCGPVQLANSKVPADPLLPRNQVSFSATGGPGTGNGAVTVGAGGYAAGIQSQSLGGTPGVISLGTTYSYGYGVWFRTSSASGQLFGLGSTLSTTPSPSGSPTFDRTLALTGGQLRFSAAGADSATTSAGTPYNDGAWHFAYVSLTSQSLTVLLSVLVTNKVTVYVDGGVAATSSRSGVNLARPSGYWFLGPDFTGSLSNFMVYNDSPSPTSPPDPPYSAATELWPLNDNGYTTYTGSLPSAISAPCTKVDLEMNSTNPVVQVGPLSLAAFANGQPRPSGTLANGANQSLTLKTAKGTGYTSDISGLHLYVPLAFDHRVGASPGWTQTFRWTADPADVFWS